MSTKKELEKEIMLLSRALTLVTRGDAHMMTGDDWNTVTRAGKRIDDEPKCAPRRRSVSHSEDE